MNTLFVQLQTQYDHVKYPTGGIQSQSIWPKAFVSMATGLLPGVNRHDGKFDRLFMNLFYTFKICGVVYMYICFCFVYACIFRYLVPGIFRHIGDGL